MNICYSGTQHRYLIRAGEFRKRSIVGLSNAKWYQIKVDFDQETKLVIIKDTFKLNLKSIAIPRAPLISSA